jgi:hypothetical protein
MPQLGAMIEVDFLKVHLYHIPTDHDLLAISHTHVESRKKTFEKTDFVCVSSKIAQSPHRGHVRNASHTEVSGRNFSISLLFSRGGGGSRIDRSI